MAQADVTEAGTNVKRCSAVNKAAREFLAQQIADGPGPRDTCSLITFNSQATGSTFEWLEKMADMSKGKFHKGMSQMLTQVRTSSPRKKSLPLRGNPSSSSLLSAPAPAAPVTTGCSWPLSGDLLAWDTASQGFKLAQQAITLLVSTPHFATGSTRLAYRATASSPAAATSLPSGPLVVKAAQDTSDQELELQAPYFACLHTAQSAAQAFPRLPAATTPKFVDCQLLRCSTEGSQRFLAVEQLLEGAYIKYNGNKGYVAPLPDDAQGRERHELAQAFSHWSWVHSGGRELVCDIQGVNSVAVKYGHKDMGAEGITAFFESHRCNGYCHALTISNNRPTA
ncbi:alpha-type protein kinase [Haematococcus lacustris]|uniref:Alpha-type protein kinase n=1 Tax=Haematococcus lacustris TaxID=44745 RepID=A0A6A0A1C3_HAELA|nr:alpha-type protein kinase [Haematococcus lacustris]